ncbi:MAG: glycerophosphodiester phosphodiesterase family protein, partial [Bacteroidota bacterium]
GTEVTIQSFDFRVLQYIHEKYPDIRLVALVENSDGVAANLEALGFTPEVYSPWYKMLSKESVDSVHRKNMKLIPWTVNDTTSMRQLIGWGVDGIITDYPNLAQKL